MRRLIRVKTSLEVVVRDYTTIGTSERKFDLDKTEPVVSEEATHKPEIIDLKDLPQQPQYQRIIVTAGLSALMK